MLHTWGTYFHFCFSSIWNYYTGTRYLVYTRKTVIWEIRLFLDASIVCRFLVDLNTTIYPAFRYTGIRWIQVTTIFAVKQ